MNTAAVAATAPVGLGEVPLHTDVWVSALQLDVAPQDHDVLLRLLEIGFLPGERLRVVARSFPGGDPLAVRVGRTTFALRRREAALVRVSTTPPAQQPVVVPLPSAQAQPQPAVPQHQPPHQHQPQELAA